MNRRMPFPCGKRVAWLSVVFFTRFHKFLRWRFSSLSPKASLGLYDVI